MNNDTITDVIENFNTLPYEEKEFTFNLIEKYFIESKRDQLFKRIEEAKQNLKDGNIKSGSLKDLLEDLNSE